MILLCCKNHIETIRRYRRKFVPFFVKFHCGILIQRYDKAKQVVQLVYYNKKGYGMYMKTLEAKIIGVDNGNTETKTRHFNFTSALTSSEYPLHAEANEMLLKWNGKYYRQEENLKDMKEDKTKDDDTYALTLMAIAKELMYDEPNRNEYFSTVRLAVGLPPQHMTRKDMFKEYFESKGNIISYEFNGKKFNIAIAGVGVFSQGIAALFTTNDMVSILEDGACLIDIGGGTTDVALIRNGKIDRSSVFTIPKGTLNLVSDINSRLQEANAERNFGQIDTFTINNYLSKGKTGALSQEVRGIIDDVSRTYINDLLTEIISKVPTIKNTANYFIGGGIKLFRRFIEEDDRFADKEFRHYIDDTKANAKGYEQLMIRHMSKESSSAATA